MLGLVEPGFVSGSTSGVVGTEMQGNGCIWKKLMPEKDSSANDSYDYFYAVSAAAAFACTLFLMCNKDKFQLRKLAYEESYNFFYAFILAMHMRVFVPKLCRFVARYAKPEYMNCEGCALLESFLTIFEIETLTHVCIDRYVVAKYISKGWPINKDHYTLYLCLCLFFAFLYSLPPVFGLGDYTLDFDCETCGFGMILPKDWTRYVVLGMWLLRSIKPIIFMVVMLFWTRRLEASYTNQLKMKSDSFFTRIIEIVTLACLFSWAPLAIVRGFVIFSQLNGEIALPPTDYIRFTPILYEISPILVSLVMVLANNGLTSIQQPFEEVMLEADQKKEE